MVGDLLWVYEGLTEYLGDVLASRCGIWTAEQYRHRLATVAATFDNRPGRRILRPWLRVLYETGGAYDNWRRSTDFYDEGELVWLDVDTTIRTLTSGKKSLDDFVAVFHGLGGNTPPKVVPYTFGDVVAGLNAVAPNDWAAFLRERLDTNQPHAPLGGIENSGYRLVYAETPNPWSAIANAQSGTVRFLVLIGLHLGPTGIACDVLKGGVSDRAGIGPGMRLLAVNGHAFTPAILRAALKDGKGDGPAFDVIVENSGFYRVLKIEYHDDERYPALERVAATPDRLDEILSR
jgi:predicted metalloprotease with PDZ domain